MNNTKFKKRFAAVGAGVALAAGIGMANVANANSLLFPYFYFDSASTSLLSMSSGPGITNTAGNVHYAYFTFSGNLNNMGSSAPTCQHAFDAFGSMTPNDLVQQSIMALTPGDPFSGNLYGDKSTTVSLPLTTSEGFLVVSDVTTANTVGTTTTGATLVGQMVVADPSMNVVFSYNGISNANTTEGDFSNINATNYRLSWYPTSAATTKWFALATGNQASAIANGTAWTTSGAFSNGGFVYNRDEVPASGLSGFNMGCAQAFDRTAFMTPSQQSFTANGGVANMTFGSLGANTSGVGIVQVQVIPGVANVVMPLNPDTAGQVGF